VFSLAVHPAAEDLALTPLAATVLLQGGGDAVEEGREHLVIHGTLEVGVPQIGQLLGCLSEPLCSGFGLGGAFGIVALGTIVPGPRRAGGDV